MSSVTIFIPGLLAPARGLPAVETPATPSLCKLLASGTRSTCPAFSFSRRLCDLFGLQAEPQQDDPVAAITHLVDDRETGNDFWMRADPVHLAADRDSVVLFEGSAFNLELQEALALAADIKDLLAEEGLELEVPTISRWYLRSSQAAGVQTTPIHEVAARDIHRFMPSGGEKDRWARLLNEIQMTLHGSAVNEARIERGELPVNSVWCWGGGRLPENIDCIWDRVFHDEIISTGMAQLAGTEHAELPEDVSGIIPTSGGPERILVILSFGLRHAQYQDITGWQDFIAYLESCWFAGLLEMVRDGTISKLTLLLEDQEFRIARSSLLKFWKPRKQLQAYLI